MAEMKKVYYESNARREQVLTHVHDLSLKQDTNDEEISGAHEGIPARVALLKSLYHCERPEIRL